MLAVVVLGQTILPGTEEASCGGASTGMSESFGSLPPMAETDPDENPSRRRIAGWFAEGGVDFGIVGIIWVAIVVLWSD